MEITTKARSRMARRADGELTSIATARNTVDVSSKMRSMDTGGIISYQVLNTKVIGAAVPNMG
jgi:hypothetical protein